MKLSNSQIERGIDAINNLAENMGKLATQLESASPQELVKLQAENKILKVDLAHVKAKDSKILYKKGNTE